MSTKNSELDIDIGTNNCVDIAQYGEITKHRWHRRSIFWKTADYLINILAFATSISIVFVETFVKGDNALYIILLSVIAATLTLIGFATRPKYYMQKYRKGFNVLNAAMIKYYAHPNEMMRDQIVEAILKGENIINGTYEAE